MLGAAEVLQVGQQQWDLMDTGTLVALLLICSVHGPYPGLPHVCRGLHAALGSSRHLLPSGLPTGYFSKPVSGCPLFSFSNKLLF